MSGVVGRWVHIAPERLDGWLRRFAERHGDPAWSADATTVTLRAADGCVAECIVPFPPLDVDTHTPFGGLVAHATRERTVGVVLVRLGGYAVGVFAGPALLTSKVGSRPVHGRAAVGGWSQQRFARRREHQAHAALQAAADTVARVLLPQLPALDALVAGGDRHAVDTVLDDPRLASLRPLLTPSLLDVPTPNRRVLDSAPARFRTVPIRVRELAEVHAPHEPD
jgi:hypothetical protein